MRKDKEFRLLLLAAAFFVGGLMAGGAAAAVDRDVYTAGGEVRTAAPVLGDYTAAGGHVIVDHPVSGDAGLAGGSIEVRARIGKDLNVAGGDVRLAGKLGGDLLAMGGNISVEPDAVVGRDARVFGSNITIDGRIEGELQANADRIVINGEVRGDARLHASHIELGPEAKIRGALHYVSDNELVKADGATVLGAISHEERVSARSRERRAQIGERVLQFGRVIGGVAAYLVVLAVAALLLLAGPGLSGAAAQRVRTTPWSALGLGLGTLLAVPVLALLLFVTILGIPLGVAVLALFPAVLLLGLVVSVLFLARALPPAFRLPPPRSFGATMGWFAAALLLVMVVARIPVLGALLMLLFALAGVGAGVMELYARRKRPAAPNGGARASAAAPADDIAGVQA